MAYKVKIEQFEGPLDLLLEIVEARKLSLVTISLSEVAEQFLRYIKTLKERSIEEIVYFIAVGSRLVLLKSRELAPSLTDPLEEDNNMERLRAQLSRYSPYRRAAMKLAFLDKKGESFWQRQSFVGHEPVFYFPKTLKADTLADSIREVLITITLYKNIPQALIRDSISLDTCILRLLQSCHGKNNFDFLSYLKTQETSHQIVHFVGMLELVRVGKVSAQQKRNFDTIVLTHHE